MIITSKDFDKQPFWFTAINKAWRSSYFLGTKIRLDKDSLIRAARRSTGFQDLGKEFNEEPLDRMLWSVENEANLHPFGRFITRTRLKGLLETRLRAEDYFKKHPEILDRPLYPAWVIVGLQRTGTTKLHRLLAADPDHRVMPSWENLNPLPLSGTEDDPQGIVNRMKMANTAARSLKLISPGFYAIHPIEVSQPEEDILLLDVSFMSTTAEAMMHVPSYASWLETVDQSPAYAYYVKLLKLLQWLRPAKRWVLKTPHHLEFLDLIERHFDQVHFVWPHRSIYESVPSFLSMVSFNRKVFSHDVDPHQVGAHWIRKTGYMLDKALAFRRQPGKEKLFIDLFYKDLVRSPIHELSRLYSMNGGFSEELSRLFLRTEKENPRQKYGIHLYSAADFGISKKEIDAHTHHYQEFIRTLHGKEEKQIQ